MKFAVYQSSLMDYVFPWGVNGQQPRNGDCFHAISITLDTDN